jgi:hypothetical protein
MQLCAICKEPAVRRVTSGIDGQTVTMCYCYVHTIEAGLLEVPLDLLKRAADETGYSVNALIFVLESLIRAGCITELETTDEVAWIVEVSKPPLEVCVALSQAAVERFHQQAGLALEHWKLRRGNDLGTILSWLNQSGALTVTGEGKEKLLGGLSTMEGFLVVEADRIATSDRPRE